MKRSLARGRARVHKWRRRIGNDQRLRRYTSAWMFRPALLVRTAC
jgi:hypothetical protein